MRKTVFSVFLLSAILMPFVYAKIKSALIMNLGAPPPCWKIIVVSYRVIWEISNMKDDYPESIEELLSRLEGSGIERKTLEYAFICPRSEKKEISFEYYNPTGLREDIERFIILYEKPNNHLPTTYRTVVYNDGQVRKLFGHQVHDLLLLQSKSSADFIWEPSQFNGICPKSWREKEMEQKAQRKAVIISIMIFLTILSLLVFYVWAFRGRERPHAQQASH